MDGWRDGGVVREGMYRLLLALCVGARFGGKGCVEVEKADNLSDRREG